ncbi:MAG: peptidoglycan DD-metalloendopeptidase family protein [Prevotellaceae bacterium]|jgi:septal ring factor EnvC (AmiA/AmiB activator)|nr:peptidoglycan DD-metalloendopeptidase family protein [Prevotellaceae bacterium]
MKKIFCIILLIFCSYSANSQTIKELEVQKKKAAEKVALTQKLLNETKKSKNGTERQITLLSRSIEQTNALILAMNSEIDGLNRDISTLQTEKTALEKQLAIVKKNYAKMVAKNDIFRKQFSPTLYIFSSKSFSQGYRRMRYLQQMSDYQKKQADEIKSLTQVLIKKETVLKSNIVQKEQTLNSKEHETQQLAQKKDEQNKLLKTYGKKEKEYQNTIAAEQEKQKKLNKLIQQKVAEENRRKAELAKKAEATKKNKQQQAAQNKGKTSPEKSAKTNIPTISDADFKQYQEDVALTGNFEKNRRLLPLPVAQGKIHRLFGRQTNPYTKAAENNNGVYFLSPSNSDARAIFDGTVFEVMYEPGSGYVVWIMHGNYSTVYAQLSLSYVKKGDKVKAKQGIGKIAVKNNNTELSFYILNKNAAYENPVNWLKL